MKVTEGGGHPGCAPAASSAAAREFAQNKARIESSETFRGRSAELRPGGVASATDEVVGLRLAVVADQTSCRPARPIRGPLPLRA